MNSPTENAPTDGAPFDKLDRDIKLVLDNPVMAEIMRLAGGMVAVVNDRRQIVAANAGFRTFLDSADTGLVFGKRFGETINCVNADNTASGCGTSLQCTSCGIVGAMIEARASNEIVQRRSPIQLRAKGETIDRCLWVRACPLQLEERHFIILFLTDITKEERLGELDRIFFHDVLNTALGISSACTLLERHYAKEGEARQFARVAKTLSSRLMKDLRVHKLLSETKDEEFQVDRESIDLRKFMREFKEIVETWSVARKVRVELDEPPADLTVYSDPHLLYRVVANMLLNACEASTEGGSVRYWAERTEDSVVLNVWNEAHISENIAPRIFQRHFSTKEGRGRGIGTHSMKYIAEKLLGGRIFFTSSREKGTVFSLALDQVPHS